MIANKFFLLKLQHYINIGLYFPLGISLHIVIYKVPTLLRKEKLIGRF